jgi:hypothetical protein
MMSKRIAAIILLVAAFTFPAYCDDSSGKQINSIKGQISHVDWVGDRISVRYQENLAHDEIVIEVPDSARITKGGNNIKLFDLHLFDSVKVEYYDDSPTGGLKAKSINVISW